MGLDLVWAVDPDVRHHFAQKAAVSLLQSLAKHATVHVHPVSVVSFKGLPVTSPLAQQFPKMLQKNLTLRLHRAFGEVIGKQLQIHTAQVVRLNSDSKSEGAKGLQKYAKKEKADLILTTTHARKGVKRFVLGSFTETLMSATRLPILALNPSCETPSSIEHILFATDFSPSSKSAFEDLMKVAKKLGAKITLAHQLRDEYLPYAAIDPMAVEVAWAGHEDYLKWQEKEKRAQASRWQKLAKQKGVRVSIHFFESVGPVAEGIMSVADSLQADVISMSSQAGPIASVLLGSLTRQVLLRARKPLLIVHPGGGK